MRGTEITLLLPDKSATKLSCENLRSSAAAAAMREKSDVKMRLLRELVLVFVILARLRLVPPECRREVRSEAEGFILLREGGLRFPGGAAASEMRASSGDRASPTILVDEKSHEKSPTRTSRSSLAEGLAEGLCSSSFATRPSRECAVPASSFCSSSNPPFLPSLLVLLRLLRSQSRVLLWLKRAQAE